MKTTTRVSSTLVLVLLMSAALAVTSGCTVREYPMYEPQAVPRQVQPQTGSTTTAEGQPMQDQRPGMLLKPPVNVYTFTLTSPGKDLPGRYTRKEAENFLCTLAPNYIQASDVYRMTRTDYFVIEATKTLASRKKTALQQEITKWFETEVSVTSRGNITPLDKRTITLFFSEINRIIGKDKFIYIPNRPMANIIIETAPPNTATLDTGPIGETAILEDNLRVRLSIKNNSVQIDTYLVGIQSRGGRSGQVSFNPEEKKFAKTNRLVKIYLGNIMEPLTRHHSLVHEMLHAIGLPGHSPYPTSHLFPFPLDLKKRGLAQPLLSGFASTMVALLYRPEILPGMTVGEIIPLLETLNRKELTSSQSVIAYLKKKKQELAGRKQDLLARTNQSYTQRMHLYLNLDKLLHQEQYLLAELAEARADNRLDTRMVDRIALSPTLSVKLSRIQTALILLQNKKKSLVQEAQARPANAGNILGNIKICDEQIVVLNDLLAIAGDIASAEGKIEATKATQVQNQMETRMRRILRQLDFIDRQLEMLTQTL